MKRFLFIIITIQILLASCKDDPPVMPPPPPVDVIKNTINLTAEWTDLYRIALKWNKAEDDTLNNFNYELIRKNAAGNEVKRTFTLFGSDTTYIDDNNGDSLGIGKAFNYTVKAYNSENKLKDTSLTVTAKTLTPTSHEIEWTIDTLGQPGNFLYDIWGLDENNVWAVGGIELPEGGTTIIKWNGNKWNLHSYPDGSANAIFGFSESDIWVAGSWANRGFLAYYNGTNWKEYKSDYFYSKGDTVYPLRAVWGSAPDDVWAVGNNATVIHWNGVEWKKIKVPTQRFLTDIYGASSNLIYAIGFSLNNIGEIIKYNGKNWENISPELNTSTRGFHSIWTGKNEQAYAVGTNVIFNNGMSWNEIDVNQSRFLTRVRGRNSADVIIAGQRGRVHHFNGTSWKEFPELFADNVPLSEIRGVAVFENNIFLVGSCNQGALFYKGTRN